MSDSISVVNTTALAVAPGGQLIEPGETPVEVEDTAEVQELLGSGVLSSKKPSGRKAQTPQED